MVDEPETVRKEERPEMGYGVGQYDEGLLATAGICTVMVFCVDPLR